MLDDSPIGGFYAFGSSLVAIPTGEHQFYTAKQLHSIYDQRLADPQDIAMIREMAIRGYQSTLDNFSGAVTYDTTGRFAFEVGPLAIDGIHALGGDVLNGWVQVTTTDGGTTVVRAQ